MQLSRRQKCFPQFFSASSKSRLNFADFQKKKMTLIANVYSKLGTAENVVR